MKLLIKLTSRQRPEKFFAALDNIKQLVGGCDYSIIATLDLDDSSMNNEEVKNKIRTQYDVVVYWGISKNKISAYNRGVPESDWDILIATSDDMKFTARYFGEQIAKDMEKYFSDTNGILHYPDGRQNNRLITLPIIGRKYFDRTKTIYNPIYETQYADDEQMQIAKRLGCYQYIPIKLFHHDYPKPNETKDALYLRNEKTETIKSDKEKYLSRLQNNFA